MRCVRNTLVPLNMSISLRQLYAQHLGLASDKWEGYFPVYERWLAPFRQQPLNLLEIGVQNGGSLAIWGQYFHFAEHIVGCDINQACDQLKYDDNRINVVVGDVNALETRQKLTAHCNGYDIVIDDGSHRSRDIVDTFQYFYPLLRPGGLYVVEDLHCSYWRQWQGGLWASESAMEFFKNLADVPNLEHWAVQGLDQRALSPRPVRRSHRIKPARFSDLESVSFYNSMCVVVKGHGPNHIGGRVVVGKEAPVFAALPPSGSPIKVPAQPQTARKLRLRK